MKEKMKGVHFIGTQMPAHTDLPEGLSVGKISPCIFRDFTAEKEISRAVVYATALGVYSLYCNGKRVGDALLRPGWTDYHKLLYVQSYDVTGLLQKGENRIGAMLGDGWFAGQLSVIGREKYGSDTLQLLMKLEIAYTDGTVQEVCSDGSFRVCQSPVRYSDFYMGECYDGSMAAPEQLFLPGGIAGQPVSLTPGTNAELVPDESEPVRVIDSRKPVSVTEHGDTVIYDFGQNLAGVCRIDILGKAGGKAVLRFGEMLHGDGRLYTENLRSAKSTDVYLCREGRQSYTPQFTFHGFRYAEVTCKDAEILEITALAYSSDLKKAGSFQCSHPLVNQIYSNILWGRLGNFIDLPTDCPQRDERMGWCGDAQVFSKTAMYQADCRKFFQKYLQNVRNTIDPQGAPYDLAPYVWGLSYGTAAWADAIVVIPYYTYLFYGDKSVICENLSAMEGWVAFQKNTSNGLIRPPSGYGDWLSVKVDDTPKDLIGTAYFAHTARLLSYLCGEIGLKEKQEAYYKLYGQVCRAFCDRFMDESGVLLGDTQTDYLLALSFRLVPDEKRPLMASHLVRTVGREDNHLTCGFVGVSLMLPALSDCGRDDLAYKILLNETYPSWGYTIQNGATTIWERWNSYTRENGFGDVGMNSFNHYSLGSVGQWFYEYMCGIQLTEDNAGFCQAVIAPHIDPERRVTSANASLETANGTIESGWEVTDGKVCIHIKKPEALPCTLIWKGRSYTIEETETQWKFSEV